MSCHVIIIFVILSGFVIENSNENDAKENKIKLQSMECSAKELCFLSSFFFIIVQLIFKLKNVHLYIFLVQLYVQMKWLMYPFKCQKKTRKGKCRVGARECTRLHFMSITKNTHSLYYHLIFTTYFVSFFCI